MKRQLLWLLLGTVATGCGKKQTEVRMEMRSHTAEV